MRDGGAFLALGSRPRFGDANQLRHRIATMFPQYVLALITLITPLASRHWLLVAFLMSGSGRPAPRWVLMVHSVTK